MPVEAKKLLAKEITPVKWQCSSRQETRSDFHAKESSTHKVDVQISYYLHPEVQEKGNLQSAEGKYRRDHKGPVQVEGVEIIEGSAQVDHIHLLVAIPPKYSVSSFMGSLKGKSALMILDWHSNLKYKYGNRHFWSRGYYVSTVGLNEATIAKYVREQEKHDQMVDKLVTKEYEDPVRGS
jgi:putative transposase